MPQKRLDPKKIKKKVCERCGKEKPVTDFYIASSSKYSSDGKYVNLCKDCIKISSYNTDGSLDMDKFKENLMRINKPFVPTALETAVSESQRAVKTGKCRIDVIGNYFRNISFLAQYSRMGFVESLNEIERAKAREEEHKVNSIIATDNTFSTDDRTYVKQVENFDVTDDIVDLFGEGYTKKQYRLMEKKYQKLKENYVIQTNLHEEALATYVRFRVKEEECTANNDVAGADKWNKAAQEQAEKAKLTPKQLTAADLQNGVTCIAEISKACEQAVDIIDILPRYRYQPNDAPDFIIYCYVNYCRKLKGLPQCEYEDIYKFYDKKKEEYIKQYGDVYGIFTNDPSKKNRPNITEFIKLPKTYEEDNGDN